MGLMHDQYHNSHDGEIPRTFDSSNLIYTHVS